MWDTTGSTSTSGSVLSEHELADESSSVLAAKENEATEEAEGEEMQMAGSRLGPSKQVEQ